MLAQFKFLNCTKLRTYLDKAPRRTSSLGRSKMVSAARGFSAAARSSTAAAAAVCLTAACCFPCATAKCVSDESLVTCSELQTAHQWPAADMYGSPLVCGGSGSPSRSCGLVTFDQAVAGCAEVMSRLCTLAELQRDEARGTGCGFDGEFVWSADRRDCPIGEFVAVSGASQFTKPPRCTRVGELVGLRCCADVAPTCHPQAAGTSGAGGGAGGGGDQGQGQPDGADGPDGLYIDEDVLVGGLVQNCHQCGSRMTCSELSAIYSDLPAPLGKFCAVEPHGQQCDRQWAATMSVVSVRAEATSRCLSLAARLCTVGEVSQILRGQTAGPDGAPAMHAACGGLFVLTAEHGGVCNTMSGPRRWGESADCPVPEVDDGLARNFTSMCCADTAVRVSPCLRTSVLTLEAGETAKIDFLGSAVESSQTEYIDDSHAPPLEEMNDKSCQWSIHCGAGHYPSILLNSLDTETDRDYLEIFDGASEEAAQARDNVVTRMASLDGRHNFSDLFVATGQSAFMRLTTDDMVPSGRFLAMVSCASSPAVTCTDDGALNYGGRASCLRSAVPCSAAAQVCPDDFSCAVQGGQTLCFQLQKSLAGAGQQIDAEASFSDFIAMLSSEDSGDIVFTVQIAGPAPILASTRVDPGTPLLTIGSPVSVHFEGFTGRLGAEAELEQDFRNKITASPGSTVTVSRLKFVQLFTSSNGAAIECRSCELAVESCHFERNVASFGGAVNGLDTNSEISIIRSEFTENAARFSGGALFTRGVVVVFSSRFRSNRAKLGGAIGFARDHGAQVTAAIVDCEFLSNLVSHSGLGGAAVASENGDVNITACYFSSNRGSGTHGGGAIYAEGGLLVLQSSVFDSNQADGQGDDITIENMQDVFIRDSDLHDFNGGSFYSVNSAHDSCTAGRPCLPADQYQCIMTNVSSFCQTCESPLSGDGIECRLLECPPGTQANAEMSNCEACPHSKYSALTELECQSCRHPGNEEPNADATECDCRRGFANLGALTKWHPELVGVEQGRCIKCSDDIFPLRNVECPGGPKDMVHIFPLEGWWLASLSAPGEQISITASDAKGTSLRMLFARMLYPCSLQACIGFTEQADTRESPHEQRDLFSKDVGDLNFCNEDMGGVLCAECIGLGDDAVKVGGVCLENCHTAERFWIMWATKLALLGLSLRWKSGYLDVAADGATIAHLTFFGQTFILLGNFGHADMFGYRRLNIFNQNKDGKDCGFALSFYGEFYTTVFLVPICMVLFLTALLHLERGKLKKLGQSMMSHSLLATPEAALGRTSSSLDRVGSAVGTVVDNKLTKTVKGTTIFKKQAARMTDATKLSFFHDPIQLGSSPEGLWWTICSLGLKEKLDTKHYHRTLLEVAMFVYMQIAEQVMGIVFCREIDTGEGLVTVSSVDPQVKCDTPEYLFTKLLGWVILLGYCVGFPLWIICKGDPKIMVRARKILMVLKCTRVSKRTKDFIAPLVEVLDNVTELGAGHRKEKTAKWTTYCRVSFVFSPSHRGWMACLLWRRALLVFVFIIGSGNGGQFTLSSGTAVDCRVFIFLLLVAYVVLQAHMQPFATESDNILEQCVLMSLLLIIFADSTLRADAIEHTSDGTVELSTIIVSVTALVAVMMVLFHKQMNASRTKLAAVGLGSGGGVMLSEHSDGEDDATQSSESADSLRADSADHNSDGVDGAGADIDDESFSDSSVEAICEEFGLEIHEVQNYKKAFHVFDEDRSGTINEDELAKVLQLMGDKVSKEKLHAMMMAADDDGSGDIDFRELVKLLHHRKKDVQAEEEIEQGPILHLLNLASQYF